MAVCNMGVAYSYVFVRMCLKYLPVPMLMLIPGVLFVCLFVFSVAWGWGDPHINTLDGRAYTFNGWGEYMLANVTVFGSFQGRTSLFPGSNATQFSAFAFGNMSARVEVSIIQSK